MVSNLGEIDEGMMDFHYSALEIIQHFDEKVYKSINKVMVVTDPLWHALCTIDKFMLLLLLSGKLNIFYVYASVNWIL